jgi:hydroxymethylpyrimidine pyrophosphatase-like HAD family hydrolase
MKSKIESGSMKSGHHEPRMVTHTARYGDAATGPVDAMARVAEGWRMVLATDLDGTFLGGAEADRRRLYDWIGEHRERVGLVFVTGRDPGFIEGLCADTPVPWPDFVVGDVGTTIARMLPAGPGGRVSPLAELEAEIAERWGDRGAEVRRRLEGAAGLTLQPTGFRYRVSYDYDPAAYDGVAERIVAEMGLDALISNDCFFDVLPRGISKGPSLSRLAGHLGLRSGQVLVAGDTLNDYSMFETDFHGVAVGGSEAELLARLADRDHVLKASGQGAAGIIEAISHFGLYDPAPGG